MDSYNGILIGKIAFYVALAALALVLIIKKIKQTKDVQRDDRSNPPSDKL